MAGQKSNGVHDSSDITIDDEDMTRSMKSMRPIELPVMRKTRLSLGSSGFTRSMSYRSQTTVEADGDILERVIRTVCHAFIRDVGDIDESFLQGMNIDAFVDTLNKERLITMPHRGSTYDRALRAAEYFALQVSNFGEALKQSVPASIQGAKVALTGCHILLSFGQECGPALDTCFALFYQLGRSLGHLLRTQNQVRPGSTIADDLGSLYSILLEIVGDVALDCQMMLAGSRSGSISIDLNRVVGDKLRSFHKHHMHIVNSVWSQMLASQGHKFGFQVADVRNWLAPQDEIVDQLISKADQRGKPAEYTCEWIQSHLSAFLSSSSQVLAITGPSGHGKSVMSVWIEDRLQRPLNMRNYETISFFFRKEKNS